MRDASPSLVRHLILVLGDQLDSESSVFDGFDPARDSLWMAETAEEATHVWCHKLRLAFFFSAMRHFRDQQRELGRRVQYHELTADPDADRGRNFAEILAMDLDRIRPQKVILVHPGDYRVLSMLENPGSETSTEVEWREDRHFYQKPGEFEQYAAGKKSLVMEYFYRNLRKREHILMTEAGEPEGGKWNFDSDNREKFGKGGAPRIPPPIRFQPDALTREVIDMVEKRFADHPGSLAEFDLPVTAEQAEAQLDDFIKNRLENFGRFEDAMWTDEAFLYHSRLSAVLNVKLLHPRRCVEAAVAAYRQNRAPLNSVEGFVRQILGWREFIRGIYWMKMPEYAGLNALDCGDRDVPGFFWDGETDMACVGECMKSVIQHGWSHHIPRLMVLGQFSLLLGVHPYKFHAWHMAMYADAVDWVSLPNALGMSQYGDGGIVGTKPYCASGNYIHKMSNYCGHCRYNPKESTGERACPFTTLYWEFLDRHRDEFSSNRRMTFQMKNLERKSGEQLADIRKQAEQIRKKLDAGERI